MRTLPVIILLLAVPLSSFAADADQARVELYRAGPKELTPEGKANVVAWSEEFLKSANFNTANQPDILKQSVTAIQDRYRKTVREDYLVVSYDRPTTFKTVAGDVTVVQIVVGLNRPDAVASGLFTIDPEGRVIAHEKYAATLPAELAPQAAIGPKGLPSPLLTAGPSLGLSSSTPRRGSAPPFMPPVTR